MASALRVLSRTLPRSSNILSRTRSKNTSSLISPPRSRGFTRTATRSEIIKKFTEDHEWISVDTDTSIGTIGVTDYAQKALGDVVYVELPEVGAEYGAGDSIGAVESVKSASDIMTPVSGKIVEKNEELDGKASLINKDAEGETGWIARIEVSEEGMKELENLLDAEGYKKFTTDSS